MTMEYQVNEAEKDIRHLMDVAEEQHVALKILREDGSPAYLISASDFESLEETLHLFGNTANAAHLRRSIASEDRVRFDSLEHLKHETGL